MESGIPIPGCVLLLKQNSGVSADTGIEEILWGEDKEEGGPVDSTEATVRTLKAVKRKRSWMRRITGSQDLFMNFNMSGQR